MSVSHSCYSQTDYDQNRMEIFLLQDEELEAVTLKSEIHELEQEKIQLGESLLEKQRELLAWEKKVQMAQETKEKTQHERGKEGDVGAMKAEIHRMQVLIHFSEKTLREKLFWKT